MKIIIAEDEQRAREGLSKLLQTIPGDYELIAQAANGQAALEMIMRLKPDVVITDIKMPFMDGLRIRRKDDSFPAAFRRICGYQRLC